MPFQIQCIAKRNSHRLTSRNTCCRNTSVSVSLPLHPYPLQTLCLTQESAHPGIEMRYPFPLPPPAMPASLVPAHSTRRMQRLLPKDKYLSFISAEFFLFWGEGNETTTFR